MHHVIVSNKTGHVVCCVACVFTCAMKGILDVNRPSPPGGLYTQSACESTGLGCQGGG